MLRDKLCRTGAHLLQCDVAETRCAGGMVSGPQGSVTSAEIAKVAHLRMDGLPQGVDPLLDATATYEPAISTGVYSYATHGAVVAVDPETGFVELLDYAVAEDCGTTVDPLLVEGQIRGVVEGVGTALYEEVPTTRHTSRSPAPWPITCSPMLPRCRQSESATSTPQPTHRIRHEGHR